MDKVIRGNPMGHLEFDMWQVRGHLTLPHSCPNQLGEGDGKREKRKREGK